MWAAAKFVGISSEEFWELSAPEIRAVLDVQGSFERAALLRAALVASTIVNVNRKKGAPLVRPKDFIREPVRPEHFMSIEEGLKVMDGWVAHHNKKVEQGGGE